MDVHLRLCDHLSARGLRDNQGLVGTFEELNRHEYQIGIANVFQVMYLVFARFVGLVACFTGAIRIFSGLTVVEVLSASAGSRRRPEIIEHMAVEADPLPWPEMDPPDPHLVRFRN